MASTTPKDLSEKLTLAQLVSMRKNFPIIIYIKLKQMVNDKPRIYFLLLNASRFVSIFYNFGEPR